MGERLRLDGYVRVSRVGGREGETFISPDDQRQRIEAWASLRDVEIAQWHIDLDETGGVLTRPGLDLMMERVRAGETGGVAVAYVDRLSRAGVSDALMLVAEIAEHGGELAALDLGIDPTTPFGEFGLTVLLALGRMQRRRISEGWDTANRRAVGRGVHAHAPFGYYKPEKGQPLAVMDLEAALVREMFERRAGGESWGVLARWVDRQGIPPRRGDHWTRRTVENVVRNRAYLGEARYGEHINPAAHEPIVTPDVFHAAQIARGVRPPRGDPALLSGLVRCAGCRHRLHAATVGERSQKVYRCQRRHGAGVCPDPVSITRRLLDEHIEAEFLRHYRTVILEGKVADRGILDAQRQVAEAEAELAAFRDNTTVRDTLGEVGGGHFEAGLTSRAKAVLAARQMLERARKGAVGVDLGPALEFWPELTVGERRRVIAEGIDAVFIRRARVSGRITNLDPRRVRIFWRGQAPEDLPGPGVRVELRGLDW